MGGARTTVRKMRCREHAVRMPALMQVRHCANATRFKSGNGHLRETIVLSFSLEQCVRGSKEKLAAALDERTVAVPLAQEAAYGE
jgi:hypothetical protein